jgi:iron(III) transport system permease protein
MSDLSSGTARAARGNSPASLWLAAAALVLALLVSLPILTIFALSLTSEGNIWPHLMATVMPGYIWRTAVLMAGVGVLTGFIGTLAAWLVAAHEFPLRRVFQWACLLPLAMPLYITSYAYVAFFNYAGPLQTYLRAAFGWATPQDYMFPDIRSLPGAILVFSAVLYPYVFMTAQAGFLRQPPNQLDAARTLGRTYMESFLTVALPQARPAIAVGVSLALMECLNDIAAANFFGVRTLTLGIYTTWLGEGNLGGAAQLATVLLLVVFVVLWLERHYQQKQISAHKSTETSRRRRLHGWQALGACLACALPVAFGFFIPAAILLASTQADFLFSPDFASAVWHSLLLAGLASLVIIAAGLVLAYAHRSTRSQWPLRLATLGYAIPGTVLGIGVLVPLAGFDNWLNRMMEAGHGITTGLLLSGSLAALVFAYTVRFLAIAFGSLEAGLHKVTPSLTAAARTLGRTSFETMREVHLPMLRPAIVSAALLVFVDCMKELPATLILRPFDFETLATLVFNLASLDKLGESAVPALAIVAAGIIPIILLSRNLRDPWFTP